MRTRSSSLGSATGSRAPRIMPVRYPRRYSGSSGGGSARWPRPSNSLPACRVPSSSSLATGTHPWLDSSRWSAMASAWFGAIDPIARPELGERLRPPVGHEDRGVSGKAVNAGMAAAAVDVDRPAKRHRRTRRYRVDDALGGDLQEL